MTPNQNDIKSFFEKGTYFWAIFSVAVGVIAGLIFLQICVMYKLHIFGIYLSAFISPVISGYVETYLAKKLYGKTTGAISALLLFFITVIYGFINPINPLELNIFLLGGIAAILQATFPILINYILYIAVVGVLFFILGKLGEVLYDLKKNIERLYCFIKREKCIELEQIADVDIDINDLGILFLSSTHPVTSKTKEHLGMVQEIQTTELNKNIFYSNNEKKDLLVHEAIEKLRKKAFLEISKRVKEMNGDAVINVEIDFNNISEASREIIQIIVTGTVIKFY